MTASFQNQINWQKVFAFHHFCLNVVPLTSNEQLDLLTHSSVPAQTGFCKKKKSTVGIYREKRGKRWELKDFCTFSLLHIYFCEFLSWGGEYLHDDLFTFGKCTANYC